MGKKELRNQIEQLREELNVSLLADKYEVYYQKSVALDELIARYIELDE